MLKKFFYDVWHAFRVYARYQRLLEYQWQRDDPGGYYQFKCRQYSY